MAGAGIGSLVFVSIFETKSQGYKLSPNTPNFQL